MFERSEVVDFLAANGVSTAHTAVENLPLPSDFAWGAATAAYQVEGGANQDGKGESIWDTFTHLVPSRTSNANADIACDHYNRVPEDVELMKSLDLDVYRFSISWSRLIPLGGRHDQVNEAGISFYNNLIDQLLEHNIKPSVTLYHWDLPQALYDRYGGFLNTVEFRADFEHYARLCFSRFGDRVKEWVTFNEPYVISVFGHHSGSLAPGHSRATGFDTKTEPWRVGHTIILTHTSVAQIYANEFRSIQGGSTAIVLNGHMYEPFDVDSKADQEAAPRRMEFYFGWFADPIFLGQDYPAVMRAQLGSRLPTFTPDELKMLRKSVHLNAFFGLNHYSTKYARALPDPPADDDITGNVEEGAVNSEGKEIGPMSGMMWLRVAPDGFRKLLNWLWKRYNTPIVITENGCPCPGENNMTVEQAIDDQFRMRYLGLYLDAISQAIYEDGVLVRGYYVWSLMDNFEWSAGYSARFGIVHVDYETLVRTPKKSASYLKNTFKNRRAKSVKL
ncbi:glycoside hydrolase superfamily [Leptodontidium sp. 2 PMI_412]|nr:glycoside hydrolase superfamily [Leptodontidium sp. MPI-SDFR-AT-0119]KAH9220645.1 glycoside hydrolase superfamily [Leptodontidium sp. 2 PMI_412]